MKPMFLIITTITCAAGSMVGCSDPMAGFGGSVTYPYWYEAQNASYTGTVWWVSKTGNNGNAGSESAPFFTIAHALSLAQDGDRILVKPGRYTEAIEFRRPGISLEALEAGTVHIAAPHNNEDDYAQAILLRPDAKRIRLQGLEVSGGYYYGINLWTQWDWGDEDRSGASHIIIQDCIIHHTGRDGIKIQPNCDDVLIDRVVIHDTGVRDDSNAEGIDNVNGDRMIVQNSHIYDIATNGLYFKGGATDCIVRNNLIENTGSMGIGVGFDTSPEFFDSDANPSMYESIGGQVYNNIINGSDWAGIGLYAAKDALVFHNTVVDAARVHHTALYFGITLQDWDADAQRPASTNARIANNIFVSSPEAEGAVFDIRQMYHDSLGQLHGYTPRTYPNSYGNVYGTSDGTAPLFTDQRLENRVESQPLQQWQGTSTREGGSTVVGELSFDSRWKPRGLPSLGLSSVQVTEDYYGTERGASPSPGAVEF